MYGNASETMSTHDNDKTNDKRYFGNVVWCQYRSFFSLYFNYIRMQYTTDHSFHINIIVSTVKLTVNSVLSTHSNRKQNEIRRIFNGGGCHFVCGEPDFGS